MRHPDHPLVVFAAKRIFGLGYILGEEPEDVIQNLWVIYFRCQKLFDKKKGSFPTYFIKSCMWNYKQRLYRLHKKQTLHTKYVPRSIKLSNTVLQVDYQDELREARERLELINQMNFSRVNIWYLYAVIGDCAIVAELLGCSKQYIWNIIHGVRSDGGFSQRLFGGPKVQSNNHRTSDGEMDDQVSLCQGTDSDNQGDARSQVGSRGQTVDIHEP